MARDSVQLEVVTPERTALETSAESIMLPGVMGHLGVLSDHAPLVAGLGIGILQFGAFNGEKQKMAISEGFVEVAENRVTVLADAAEMGDEIDVLRAREAKDRAERRLRRRTEDLDFQRAQRALHRALVRLQAAGEDDDE